MAGRGINPEDPCLLAAPENLLTVMNRSQIIPSSVGRIPDRSHGIPLDGDRYLEYLLSSWLEFTMLVNLQI